METKEFIVDSVPTLEEKIREVRNAAKEFATFTQEQVDKIFLAAASAANKERITLARLAVEETGMGVVEDKIIKNHYASEYIFNKHKNAKTCGVIKEDKINGTKIVAEPLGILAGIIPTTNPTSTAIFKSLISLKTRNAIIFSPHPRAKACTIEAAKVVLEAAVKAGAPRDIIGWIDEPSMELSNALLHHPDISCILATGGPGMVKAAYSSGKPALGVGPGNVPAIIDETAEINMAVSYILMSKTFDNGMICASEQSVTILDSVYNEVKKEFAYRGAYILNKTESEKVGKIILTENGVNPKIVGQTASTIAKLAGIKVPEDTKVLISERAKVDEKDPFAHEKLSPILALFKADDYDTAVQMAHDLAAMGYDCIIGSHPHVLQPYREIKIGNKIVPVFYSLGNFLAAGANVNSRSAIASIKLKRKKKRRVRSKII